MKILKLFLIIILSILVCCTEQYRVIIIGAGAAGVATATRLLENHIDDILVLEAEARIGGRIHTVDLDGRKVDLGAQWVGGEIGNAVYETLEGRQLLHLLGRDVFPEKFYLSSRENINETFSKELFDIIIGAFNVNKGSGSVGSILQNNYRKTVINKYGIKNENFNIFNWSENYLRHFYMFAKGSFSWYDNAYNSDYTGCQGYQNYGWKNHGYGKFLDILINKYPDPNIQLPFDKRLLLNKKVTKIIIKDDYVSINCSDHSSYRAKHVVFTPSLGVLKKDHKTIFTPELTTDKKFAIERIGIGAIIKVFLKYENRWWGNSTGFNFIWTDRDRELSKTEFSEGPSNKHGQSWIAEIYSIIVMPNSNILLVVFTGDMVPVIETMGDQILMNGINFTIKKFLGHLFTVPLPQKMLRSNWYQNPHFRGTYSFSSVNSTGEDVRNLITPITNTKGYPVVLFAGEATSPLHHSTAHAAVESGFREADRIINLYKN